jgi:NADH-quinone oxidoreductase subunit L
VFLVGAMALAGLPIANGFWSKELILEAGAEKLPLSFILMLLGAGLTAAYTIRVVWLVFFGKRRGEAHVHDAPPAMRIVLAILALGALTTWLLAGPFSLLLQSTLPFHELHSETTLELVTEVLTAPATWLALAVIAAGLAAWRWRGIFANVLARLRLIEDAASSDFGFEWLNRRLLQGAQRTAMRLRRTQTGQLNWNALGIVSGLLIVLIVVLIGR